MKRQLKERLAERRGGAEKCWLSADLLEGRSGSEKFYLESSAFTQKFFQRSQPFNLAFKNTMGWFFNQRIGVSESIDQMLNHAGESSELLCQTYRNSHLLWLLIYDRNSCPENNL